MFKSWKTAIAAAVLATGLGAGCAQAALIIGTISISDGLLGLPTPPSGSVVSGLTGISHEGLGLSTGCTNSFVGSCGGLNATMTDWDFAGPFPDIIVVNGFTFDLKGHGAITPTALSCGGAGTCGDDLVVANLVGIVSKAGFDDTAFSGTLTLFGSCLGSGGICTSGNNGTYAYTLLATDHSTAPEPGTFLLVGIALAGLGFGVGRRNRLTALVPSNPSAT